MDNLITSIPVRNFHDYDGRVVTDLREMLALDVQVLHLLFYDGFKEELIRKSFSECISNNFSRLEMGTIDPVIIFNWYYHGVHAWMINNPIDELKKYLVGQTAVELQWRIGSICLHLRHMGFAANGRVHDFLFAEPLTDEESLNVMKSVRQIVHYFISDRDIFEASLMEDLFNRLIAHRSIKYKEQPWFPKSQ